MTFPILLAQSAQDVQFEIGRLQRNFESLTWGWFAAWAILVVYVLMMVSRERKLKRELAGLKAMLEEKR
jgi:hypothetical protein